MLLSLILFAAGFGYDLGGPCVNVGPVPMREMVAAKKAADWNRLVELRKEEVRGGCSIGYRWDELVEALVEAQRPAEAVQAMEEMDARGFDLNPSSIAAASPEVGKFMLTPLFRKTGIGMKIDALKKVSDQRRARFRARLEALPASRRPPENYVAKGACPFECCRYGKWTVREDTTLVDAPGGTRVVGTARKGAHVPGVTGEVHLKPEPVVVLVDGELPKDTIAFILDYEGEGYGHVYTRGKVVSVPLNYQEYCTRVSEMCWGETLMPASEKKKKAVWWVKVKLGNGVSGWTTQTDHFGGMDACGS